MTDVQVPPLAPHIRRTSASTADRIGGLQLMSKAIVSNHESGLIDTEEFGFGFPFALVVRSL
ncbi:hypothetical protein [Mesorhizobium sp. M0244]|uniref:hypothetical protein n=1 Tax=Mesorhizobium sp. M0244 TaxID=2956926 RepID=UPI003339A13E